MLIFFVALLSYVLAGLGLGGGVLLIPVLVNVFGFNQVDAGYISLLAYIPTGILLCVLSRNFRSYYKILPLIPLGIAGAVIGAMIAKNINIVFLKYLYSVFMILFGGYLCVFNVFFYRKKE